MADVKQLSAGEMIPLIREILQGQDLSQVTARIVREKVIQRLGDDIASDMTALKASVKSALDVVLRDTLQNQDNESQENPAATIPEADEVGKTEGDDAEADDEADAEDDGADSDFDAENDSESDQPKRKPSRRSKPKGQSADEKPARPKKRARVAVDENCPYRTESDFNKMKRLCRLMGCPAPPSRQQGQNMPEKCANLLGFLRSKGVKESYPTRIKKDDIQLHRKRIEREKDLEGLDVSNIIEEEGRPRRRRSAAPVPENELPSDLSGPELSEKSEDGGDDYAVSDADSE